MCERGTSPPECSPPQTSHTDESWAADRRHLQEEHIGLLGVSRSINPDENWSPVPESEVRRHYAGKRITSNPFLIQSSNLDKLGLLLRRLTALRHTHLLGEGVMRRFTHYVSIC